MALKAFIPEYVYYWCIDKYNWCNEESNIPLYVRKLFYSLSSFKTSYFTLRFGATKGSEGNATRW